MKPFKVIVEIDPLGQEGVTADATADMFLAEISRELMFGTEFKYKLSIENESGEQTLIADNHEEWNNGEDQDASLD